MENDYICLMCGSRFLAVTSARKECPRCGSTNALKLSPAGLMGYLGGG